MKFLASNYNPVKTAFPDFTSVFYRLTAAASRLDIAVGYISSDAVIELKKIAEMNEQIRTLNLIIGMHYFDLFTKVQYHAVRELNGYLKKQHRGEVRLVKAFRYHGKLYSYSNSRGPFAAVIGSNNLSSITRSGSAVYENALLIEEIPAVKEISLFIGDLSRKAAQNIDDFEIQDFNEENLVLKGIEGVQLVGKIEADSIKKRCCGVSFEIPLKPYEEAPKSNLNAFFGKGRESKNGLVRPRPWYEAELIVPKKVTSQAGYPQAGTESGAFTVITDDGWQFDCQVSGDFSKNFRSKDDLAILGKWIKGRLENEGVLETGDPVTEKTLQKYGRNTLTLMQTETPGLWFLDFGVNH